MTAACGLCCPDSFIFGWLEPLDVVGEINTSTQFISFRQDEDCNHNPLAPYDFSYWGTWRCDDTSVAAIDSTGLATAVGLGATTIEHSYDAATYTLFIEECIENWFTVSRSASCDVIPPPPCAVPVRFRRDGNPTASGGTLTFSYSWNSSIGNLANLSGCTVGEIVDYPGSNPVYTWPYPMIQTSNDPDILNLSGTLGGFLDNHSPPGSFAKPYNAASFTATQRYRYRCPCANNGNYVNLTGPISITRSVMQNPNGSWKYTVTKQGFSATINPLP
jgi:hypothetical protein